jgi:hypothetical protein
LGERGLKGVVIIYEEGGLGKWEGGKRSFTLINREVKKVLMQRKGGGSKKFLNLNTMSRVCISIITNGKKKTLKLPFPTI